MTINPIVSGDRSNIPEVVGSNPTPATNDIKIPSDKGGLFI